MGCRPHTQHPCSQHQNKSWAFLRLFSPGPKKGEKVLWPFPVPHREISLCAKLWQHRMEERRSGKQKSCNCKEPFYNGAESMCETRHLDDVWYWKSANNFLAPELPLPPLQGQYWFPWALPLEFACLGGKPLPAQHKALCCTPRSAQTPTCQWFWRELCFSVTSRWLCICRRWKSPLKPKVQCWTHTALRFIQSLSSHRSTWTSGWYILWLQDIWVNLTVFMLYTY